MSATKIKTNGSTVTIGAEKLERDDVKDFEVAEHVDFVPADETYIDEHGVLEELAWAWNQTNHKTGKPFDVLLTGPTGVGKTAAPRKLCALINRPYRRIACQEATDSAALIGKPWLWVPEGSDQQEMVFQRGPVYDGTMYGHAIVLDEWNHAAPDVQTSINPLFNVDEGALIVMDNEGEIVPRHDRTVIAATANPSTYAGTKEWNAAVLSRFDWVIEVDYLSHSVEVDLLVDKTGIDKSLATQMVAGANAVRAAERDQTIRFAPSVRELMRWAEGAQRWGVRRAAERALLGKVTDKRDDAPAVRDLLKASFNPAEWGA